MSAPPTKVRSYRPIRPSGTLSHPLAAVNGAFTPWCREAEAAGRLRFYGQARAALTASAVTGDSVMAARNRVLGAAPL